MHQNRPSLTAWAVALRRAAHQFIDDPLVLEDSLAVQIVGRTAVQDSIAKENTQGDLYRTFSRSLRAAVVARSRFAEDQLAIAHAAGIRQYLILGAGLDTFAHRNPFPSVRVFEVDHPATQQWKRRLLHGASITSPANLTFVPVDFERESLARRLDDSGFNPSQPAFISMLGVVPYLALAAFRQTLSFFASLPKSTQFTFDYASDPDDLGIKERAAFDMLAQRVKAAGEPFKLMLRPQKMHAEINAAGISTILDLSSLQMNARYFQDRADGFQILGTIGRFLTATV
ncbi:MAG TPA: class I SAM-dependent methyltransferase [Phycisphaerae bacterium]